MTFTKDKHLSSYHKRIQAVYLRSQKLTDKTLDDAVDKLQEVIQGLHRSVLKTIVHRNGVFSDFGIGWV